MGWGADEAIEIEEIGEEEEVFEEMGEEEEVFEEEEEEEEEEAEDVQVEEPAAVDLESTGSTVSRDNSIILGAVADLDSTDGSMSVPLDLSSLCGSACSCDR